ncbi:MAG: DUF2085 domain-containing protein, partial [Promethearchaeota archaeon]
MLHKIKESRTDFNTWNILFILIYCTNKYNLYRYAEFGSFLNYRVGIIVVDVILLSLLLYTRGILSSFLTLSIAELLFFIGNVLYFRIGIIESILSMMFLMIWVLIYKVPSTKGLDCGSERMLASGVGISRLFVVGTIKRVLFSCFSSLFFVFLLVFDLLVGHYRDFWWAYVFLFPCFIFLLDLFFRLLFRRGSSFYHVLLTHHNIDEKDHAISIRIGNLDVYFCTRCFGTIIGILLAYYIIGSFDLAVDPLTALIIDVFMPIPVFLDWGSQHLGLRKSTTVSRLITGATTGVGLYLLSFTFSNFMIYSSLLLIFYFSLLFLIYILGFKLSTRELQDDDGGDQVFD